MAGYPPYQVGFRFDTNSFSTFANQVAGRIQKGPNLNLLDVAYLEIVTGFMLSAGQPVKLNISNESDVIVVNEIEAITDDVLGIITYQQNPNYINGDRFVIAQEGNIINMLAGSALSVGTKVALLETTDITLPSAIQTSYRVISSAGAVEDAAIIGTVVSRPSTQADDIVAIQLKFEKKVIVI